MRVWPDTGLPGAGCHSGRHSERQDWTHSDQSPDEGGQLLPQRLCSPVSVGVSRSSVTSLGTGILGLAICVAMTNDSRAQGVAQKASVSQVAESQTSQVPVDPSTKDKSDPTVSAQTTAATPGLAVNGLNAWVPSGVPAAAPSTGVVPTATAFTNTFEVWRLPAGERMGMLGSNLMFDVHRNVRLGVGTYGALTGNRGGFITLGFSGDVRQQLSENWSAHAGVFVGAGGGSGGLQLAGGGFMFRAAGGLTYRLGALGNVGVGLSWVTFPTGQVKSVQPYVMYEYPFHSALTQGWPQGPLGPKGGLMAQSNRQEFSLGWTGYKIPSSVRTSNGGPQNETLQLVGVKWTSYLDQRWFMTIGADGAFAGDNAGYMQILGGFGYRLPLGQSTALKLYAQAGPAGGGALATGGGLIYGGGIALQQMITDRWAIELSLGAMKASSGEFKATQVGLNLSYVFGTPRVTRGDQPMVNLSTYSASPVRLRAINQTYLKADDQWRTQSSNTPVNNMGVALDYFFNRNLYVTGQGLAAYTGDAGAYMTGLLGLGFQTDLSKRWFLTAEALVGAAGGGTMAMGNGSVWQVNAGLGYRLTDNLAFTLTAGRMQAPTGQFKANVIGASLAYRFGIVTK